jgi:hypothetical protein
MGLQHFLPIDVVGRCILSLCVVLPAYATYYFLRQACPENIQLASFGVFMALNPNLQLGSISNEFSLAFCLIVVGLWVSYCRSLKITTAAGVAVGVLERVYYRRPGDGSLCAIPGTTLEKVGDPGVTLAPCAFDLSS